MTDEEAWKLHKAPEWPRVKVTSGDYEYEGWLVSVFPKFGSEIVTRCVVQDDNRRLFIHNPGQLTFLGHTSFGLDLTS